MSFSSRSSASSDHKFFHHLSLPKGFPFSTRRAYICIAALMALLVLGIAGRPTFARQTPQELVSKGDIYWNEKSYELAANAYIQALAKDNSLPNRAQIDYRLMVAGIRAEKWDAAAAASEAFVLKYKETTWEARGQVWRGRLYALIPHTGYRVGKKDTRGNDVPKSEGGNAPVVMNWEREDKGKVREAFLRAQTLFERFRKSTLEPGLKAELTQAEIDLDFDLARVYDDDMTWRHYRPESIDWSVDLSKPFDGEWPGPKKTIFLYHRICDLDAMLPGTNHHNTVLAVLGEATYILKLRQGGRVYTDNYLFEDLKNTLKYGSRAPRSRPASIPYEDVPYREVDPIALLQSVITLYPNDVEADRLQFTIAVWTEEKGDSVEAIGLYGAFESRYPTSRWVSDARSHLQNLLSPTLSINASALHRPGQRAIISITSRNLSQVRFIAYRVHPEEVFGHTQYTYNNYNENWIGHPAFANYDVNWGAHTTPYRKEKVAEWTITTSSDGKHSAVSDTVTTPLDAMGAYLIEARAGDHDGFRYSTLMIVSDLALVQKVDKNSVLVYAAEAISGKPVAEAKLTLWEPVYAYNSRYYDRDARYVTAQTDGTGTFRGELPLPLDTPERNNVSQTERQAAVFAQAGPNRYAVTRGAFFADSDVTVGERAFRAYVTTDRSLYRPKQNIKIRAVLVSGTPGSYQPATGKTVKLIISGPHGELLNKQVKTGEYGSISDSLTLPDGADLGDYTAAVQTPADPAYTYGSVSFRVEEYKKPEFTVSVTPEKSEVRVGEIMRVTIESRYFFGAPVMNAKVHYRVTRTPYNHSNPDHSRLNWVDDTPTNGFSLASYSGDSSGLNTDWWANRSNGVYKEGDLVTDAKGEAHLTFPTDLPKPPRAANPQQFRAGDESFVIAADVVDDSRRTVSGVGSARATSTQFAAFMTLDKQFVLPGDTLTIAIRARDGGDKPFSAGGYVSFVRLIPAIPESKHIDPNTGKYVIDQKYVPAREEDDGKLFVQTDAAQDGVGKTIWHPDKPGDYRLEYNAQDAWGNTVRTGAAVLVYSPQWDALLPKEDRRFQLVAEHGDYKPGDTARVLLVAPVPDSYVLFTEQAIGGIIHYRTVFVPGRSTLINVAISESHYPNAGFGATIVYEGQVQETACEVGVPAVDKILALQITPDKAGYKPGEHAVFTLHASDAAGRPAQGELSMGVVDQSLLAIQADLSPDIRRFFYGFRLQTQVAGATSESFSPGAEMAVPQAISYESHALTYPEGMGWLPDYTANRRNVVIPGYSPYYASGNNKGKRVARDKRIFRSGLTRGMGFGRASLSDTLEAAKDAPEAWNLSYKSPQGAAAGFLHGIRPGDIYALDTDNSLVLRQEGEALDPASLVAATVRRLFADTAFWTPAIVTDKQGNATVAFDFPDNITEWHITARGVTKDIRVGVEELKTVTKKNLLVRLQAPRFFVDRDQVTISANIHNYLASDKNARIELETETDRIEISNSASPAASALTSLINSTSASGVAAIPTANTTPTVTRMVSKDGEVRVDWTVNVRKAGLTKIKVIAQTDTESDAAEMTFPVLVHGVEKFIALNGTLKNGGNATLTFDLPDLRRKGASLLDVQMCPSLASVMLDALPYLEDYPYGCVEQTTSRFVPTVLVAKALRTAGIDLETLGKRARALEEQRRNIPPQQIFADSGYTYPKGIPGVLDTTEMAHRLSGSYHNRSSAPIFDSATLKAMTDAGLQKLTQMQRPDGSWGWWPGSAQGDPYLTAYVLESLLHAQQADIAVKPELVDKAYSYVEQHFDSAEDLHLIAYYDYVLCLRSMVAKIERSPKWAKTHAFLYERRDRMSAYGQALLALAAFYSGEKDKAGILVRNLTTTAKRDDNRGTAHWEGDSHFAWRWYNDKQETTAMCLRALVAVGKESVPATIVTIAAQTGNPAPQYRDLAAMAARWLVDNQRSGHWTSTKQTAIVIESLIDYARAEKEFTPDYTVTLDVDGKVQKTYHIDRTNSLLFDNRFLVGDEILTSGGQQLHVTMQGQGTLYYSAYMKYFDMAEPITAQSNAISVERKYYKIVTAQSVNGKDKNGKNKNGKDKQKSGNTDNSNAILTGNTVPSTGDNVTRIPLADGATLNSGDIIEVELYLTSDNDYDHLVFEDMKPAGCEAVETHSGEAYGDGLCSNMELRDEKVAFFIDTLPQGTRRLTYRLRAEIPGRFHALPTNAYAMYAPDIRALSNEWRVNIVDLPTR